MAKFGYLVLPRNHIKSKNPPVPKKGYKKNIDNFDNENQKWKIAK